MNCRVVGRGSGSQWLLFRSPARHLQPRRLRPRRLQRRPCPRLPLPLLTVLFERLVSLSDQFGPQKPVLVFDKDPGRGDRATNLQREATAEGEPPLFAERRAVERRAFEAVSKEAWEEAVALAEARRGQAPFKLGSK